jgi:hypothetical protein
MNEEERLGHNITHAILDSEASNIIDQEILITVFKLKSPWLKYNNRN